MSGMGSGTSSLRETKPDPMPTADRDGQPYLKETEYGLQRTETEARGLNRVLRRVQLVPLQSNR